MSRRLTAAQRRKVRADRAGLALIAAVAIAFAGMLYGAYKIDQARGISIDQSLRSAGL